MPLRRAAYAGSTILARRRSSSVRWTAFSLSAIARAYASAAALVSPLRRRRAAGGAGAGGGGGGGGAGGGGGRAGPPGRGRRRARPARGPSAKPTATARLSST